MQLRAKFWLLAVGPLLLSLALIGVTVWQQQQDLARRERALVEETMMAARRAELRHYVELALSAVQPLLHDADEPARRAALQAEALRRLAALDYGSDGYFFVYDWQGRVLMHSRQPELVGQNLWGLRDGLGRPTIQQLIARARHGGGYVDYLWRKPSSGQMTPKLGYVTAVEPWQWMLGTGLYLDDVQATVHQVDLQVRQHVDSTLAWIAGIAVLGVALISVSGLMLNVSEHRQADAQLRLLARQVVQSQEQERARLARELHDGTSQTLVSGKLLIESAVAQIERAGQPVPPTLGKALERLNDSLTEVRRLSHRLRPALLDTLGLAAALEHLAGELGADVGVAVHFAAEGPEQPLGEDIKTALFRVAQEALANALKHAGAAHIGLRLVWRPERVELQVQDDGAGFDPERVGLNPSAGIGLRNMRERMATVGGRLELQSSPGHGTALTLSVPLGARPGSLPMVP